MEPTANSRRSNSRARRDQQDLRVEDRASEDHAAISQEEMRNDTMNTIYIPALAGFGGSAFGALSTIITNWAAQRRKDRARHHSRSISKREELYKSFVEETSRLYADALLTEQSEASKLVDMYALIGRMKIMSSDEVVDAAEKAALLIIKTYTSPNRSFADIPEFVKEMDPLRDFSEACRRELQLSCSR